MKASVVPATTVPWKCPGTYSVLCMIRLICSVPMTTPEIPPMKPKNTSDMNMPAKAGLTQGALRSHSNMPLVRPRARCAASIEPGTVMPCTMLPRTARYIA